MSYYYKYQFISPEGVYALVAEELKSYMDTGSVDSLVWPSYLDKCLRKLGRATYVISEEILFIEDFEARLPDNFHAVREAWLCTEVAGYPYQSANSFYSQAASSSTIQISPMTINGEPCTNPQCVSGCDECMPNLVQAIYKTNNSVTRTFNREYLLKPGNISARNSCDVSYLDDWQSYSQSISKRQFTPFSSSYDSFDVRDNKFVTNFRNGVVNLVFYATEYDGVGNQLIPDNYYIKQYIEDFIKFKVFEQLSNQITDETFNQIIQKLQYYKQQSDESYILAFSELRRQTPWDKQRRIKNTLNRLNMYELPNKSSRSLWKRNI
jgi:hypothetical protein